MKPIFIYILILSFGIAHAQTNTLPGSVSDGLTHEPLAGVSIMMYQPGHISGSISNADGKFSIRQPDKLDSVRLSMIGYKSRLFTPAELLTGSMLVVNLQPAPSDLPAIVVRPISAIDIVRKAARQIPSLIPTTDFESSAFYREIIRDSLQFYAVSEAIFNIQFNVQKKSLAIKLAKGRSKEDVAYTRLFEDFHPGGGPEDAVGQNLVTTRPGFLTENKLKNYIFKKDSTILQGDRLIYVISFDQQPSVQEALEKGKLYIDADDFSPVKYIARNSPAGTPYIKSLRGTDKIFAEILHIDLEVKGWTRTASFTEIEHRLYLADANMGYDIAYKQPKKSLDLRLQINTELVVTDFTKPIVHPVSKGEEWKRKDLVANLPADFDSAYWGSGNTPDPTREVKDVIEAISKKNGDPVSGETIPDWSYLNGGSFVASQKNDSIILVPLMKSSWEDDETGGMIYKNMKGDFDLETKLSISKRSNFSELPDNGFQQCGIILRSATGKQENNLILSMGTGGNEIPKFFLKRTINGKTKNFVEKTDSLTAWLRIEKRGKQISAFKKQNPNGAWEKIDDYSLDWLSGELQVGFSVMARFTGDGPRQRPDMRAVFSEIKLNGIEILKQK
jgi:hypothetical protein